MAAASPLTTPSSNFLLSAANASRSCGSGVFGCWAKVGKTKPIASPVRIIRRRIFIVWSSKNYNTNAGLENLTVCWPMHCARCLSESDIGHADLPGRETRSIDSYYVNNSSSDIRIYDCAYVTTNLIHLKNLIGHLARIFCEVSFIHFLDCLLTGKQPLPRPNFNRVRSM